MDTPARLATISLALILATLLLLPAPASAQQQLFQLHANGYEDPSFGRPVDLSSDYLVVSNPGRWEIGAVYLFDPVTGQQLRRLDPLPDDLNIEEVQYFGFGASICGDRVLIGDYGNEEFGWHSGAAYVYDAPTGQQLHKLIPAGVGGLDEFGYSTSIEGDFAAVGAPYDSAGTVYIYDTATWQVLFKLHRSTGGTSQFGACVEISGDQVIVGGMSGAAYLFDLTTGQELHRLLPLDGGGGTEYGGDSVALQGRWAVVGSTKDDDNGPDSGSAYVFDVNTGQQLLKLLPSDGAPGEHFGCGIAIHGDRVLIGAPWGDDCKVYLFDLHTGRQLYELYSTNDPDSYLGGSIAFVADRALVGGYGGKAIYFDMNEPGTGYCFGESGSGTPCPCSNDNDGSLRGAGCDNGIFSSGAKLVGNGVADAGEDDLILTALHAEPNNTGLFFQGNGRVNGGAGIPFGDGLRCAGFGVIRLEICFADAFGSAGTTIPIAAAGGVVAGDAKRYQYWYRTTVAPPCGAGVNDFNLSNGYEVVWGN